MAKTTGKGVGNWRPNTVPDDVVRAKILEVANGGEEITLKWVAEQCCCHTRRVKRLAAEMGFQFKENTHNRPAGKPVKNAHHVYDMLAKECRDAMTEEGGLDNDLGRLLSVLTGVPMEQILKLSKGMAMNLETTTKTGVIYKATCSLAYELEMPF